MKGTKELIKGLRTGASTIVKEGGEYVIRKAVVSNLDEIRNIAKIMDDFPNLRALGNNAESLAEKLLKASDGDTQILSRLNSLPDKAIETFAKDFSQADDILAKFAKDPDLIKAWEVLSNGKDALRSIDNVNAVHAFKIANPNVTDNVIKAVFDGLKESRKQPFINALKSCTDNTELIGSLSKTKLASVDEIKDALNKIRDYRTGKAGGGNYGYLDGTVKGNAVDNKVWKSGPANTDIEPQIFDAIPVTGSNGTTWLRNTDSEFKMLNKLADDLGGVKGKTYSDVKGTLKIVSENSYCTSCQGVIQQFSEMFPNIEIKLIDGVR